MDFFQSNRVSCKPISTVQGLLNWSPKSSHSGKYHVEPFDRSYITEYDNKPNKLLVCHDMRNNYLEDRYFQGSGESNSYTFYHWSAIDLFVYFSHHMVTVPPESWINAAHENNVRCLGTFITEFSAGVVKCDELFAQVDTVVDQLVEITLYYGFDGWLINIENPIEKMDKLKYLVDQLTKRLHQIDPDLYKIIWYDSVIETGELKWQNELNERNKSFFDLTDGIFLNYTWNETNLHSSKSIAATRYTDVFVGIDIFGRGCVGNGGFNTRVAFELVNKSGLSCALFAPGWIHECRSLQDFYANTELFWSLIQEFISQRSIKTLPLATTFTHSTSADFFVSGVSTKSPWSNLNLQSVMPNLSINNQYNAVEWCFDDAFFGSSSIKVNKNSMFKLFDMNVPIGATSVISIDYCVKPDSSNPDKLRIILEYSASPEKKVELEIDEQVTSNDIEIRMGPSSCLPNSWIKKTCCLTILNELRLTALKIKNEKYAAKLGFIRIRDVSNPVVGLSFTGLGSSSHRLFTLEGVDYLSVKLDLKPLVSGFKILNIYVASQMNSDSLQLRYIGSTKSDSFSTCFKLNQNYVKDLTNEMSSNRSLSFSVIVQLVDKHLENLYEICELVEKKDMNSDKYKSIRVIQVKEPRLKFRDSKQLDFIQSVIFDAELF